MKTRSFIKTRLQRPLLHEAWKMQTLIPLTHVYQPTLESDGARGIWSQRLPNVIYAVKFPFTEILCCTCEWALRGNICKHQIVVVFTCLDISQEDIIHYHGRWYGSHCEGLGHMFADPQHIPSDMESNDDDEYEHFEGDDGIMEFDGLMNMEQSDFPISAIIGSNDTIHSSTPIENAFAQLVTTMQEIIDECKEGDVTLREHATSHMRVLACNICKRNLTKANVILHLGLVLHRIEDGLGNNVKQFKNWHETLLNHTNLCTK